MLIAVIFHVYEYFRKVYSHLVVNLVKPKVISNYIYNYVFYRIVMLLHMRSV